MIDADQNYVPEGESIVLTATGMNGQITWTSSNPARATVTSAGIVEGILAGPVTITASCEGYTDKKCNIWVTVPDGYYYFENSASGLCLNPAASSQTKAETYIDEKDITSNYHASEMWKIKYISSGKYIIRPMCRLVSCLTKDSNQNAVVVDYHIADTFSAVPLSASWSITHNSFGYYFTSNGVSTATLQPEDAENVESKIVTGSWSSTLNCHWQLVEAHGVVLKDISTNRAIYPSSTYEIELGETYSYLENVFALTIIGEITDLDWFSSSTTVATVDTAGCVTGLSEGIATITVRVLIKGVYYNAAYGISVVDSSASSHSHSFVMQPRSGDAHPHATEYLCDCGEEFSTYGLRKMCSSCQEGATTLTVTETGVLPIIEIYTEEFYIEGEGTVYNAIPFFHSVVCTVEYENYYRLFSSNSYSYPPFASFASSITSSYQLTDGLPDILSDAIFHVDYYLDDGILIASQPMMIAGYDTGCATNSDLINVYTLNVCPAYAKASVRFTSRSSFPLYVIVEVTAHFP